VSHSLAKKTDATTDRERLNAGKSWSRDSLQLLLVLWLMFLKVASMSGM